jgi:HAD superfamily hydrolase (TIGR01484 family)
MADFSDILLAVDFDRTLTAPDSSIPERNIEAIKYFITNGGTFTVNTGRSIPMCKVIFEKVPVNAPLLLYNGSAMYDSHKQEFISYAPIEIDAGDMLRKLQARFPRMNIEIQGEKAHYALQENPGWQAYSEYNCAWAYTDYDHIPQPFIKFTLYSDFGGVTVSSMYHAEAWELEMMDEAKTYLQENYGGLLDMFHPCPRILDVHAKGISKLKIAKDLQKMLGKKRLVCVGDAPNDIQMLDGADFAFCPSDGSIADRYENVCECAMGAVADVIYEKLPKISVNEP